MYLQRAHVCVVPFELNIKSTEAVIEALVQEY